MQGNLQLADMPVHGPFDGFINALGIGAQAAAPYAAAASFAFYGAVLVLGIFAAYGLKKLADRARYRRFRRQFSLSALSGKRRWSPKAASSTRVLTPAE